MSNNSRIPEARFTFRHKLPLQLRFTDVDMFGHVNNTVYLQYCDLGKLRYFNAALGGDFLNSELQVVVVNINCDFHAPSFLNETLEVWTAIDSIGEKSLTLEQRIVNPETDEVKFIAHTVMVGFDPNTLQSALIPDGPRKAFEAYEQRKLNQITNIS